MKFNNEPRSFDINAVLNGLPVETVTGKRVQFLAYINGIPAPLVMSVGGEMVNYYEDGTSRSVTINDDSLVNVSPIDFNIPATIPDISLVSK